MARKRHDRIVVLVAALAGCTSLSYPRLPVRNAGALSDPPLRLVLSAPPAADAAILSVSLSVERPDSTFWSKAWSQPGAHRDEAEDFEAVERGWFQGVGTYRLEFVLGQNGRTAKASVFVDGNETALEVHAWVDALDERNDALEVGEEESAVPVRPFIALLRIERVLESNGVRLESDWQPAIYGVPRYRIRNEGKTAIFGTGVHGNLFGIVEQLLDGKPVSFLRGGFCGTVAPGRPLEPGESVESIEGFFIGRPRPMPVGKYRYVVRYTLEPMRFQENLPRNELSVQVNTLFEAADEFDTAAPEPPAVDEARACELRGVEADGRLTIAITGREVTAQLHGIEMPSGPSEQWTAELKRRAMRSTAFPRCEVIDAGAVPRVKLLVFGRKSEGGGGWSDLGRTMLVSGLARVAAGEFPERQEYLKAEQDGRRNQE
ncbi:MAG: hypothetical protein HY901_09990 [Deltaproteobacteria bacterium]|nr:hypothetical protein [Deltaproteobacteria bacterium]